MHRTAQTDPNNVHNSEDPVWVGRIYSPSSAFTKWPAETRPRAVLPPRRAGQGGQRDYWTHSQPRVEHKPPPAKQKPAIRGWHKTPARRASSSTSSSSSFSSSTALEQTPQWVSLQLVCGHVGGKVTRAIQEKHSCNFQKRAYGGIILQRGGKLPPRSLLPLSLPNLPPKKRKKKGWWGRFIHTNTHTHTQPSWGMAGEQRRNAPWQSRLPSGGRMPETSAVSSERSFTEDARD